LTDFSLGALNFIRGPFLHVFVLFVCFVVFPFLFGGPMRRITAHFSFASAEQSFASHLLTFQNPRKINTFGPDSNRMPCSFAAWRLCVSPFVRRRHVTSLQLEFARQKGARKRRKLQHLDFKPQPPEIVHGVARRGARL
jgi:hypothetical protein